MKTVFDSLRPLSCYFFLSYFLLLLNAVAYLKEINYVNWLTIFFSIAVYLIYCFAYLGLCFSFLSLSRAILFCRFSRNFWQVIKIKPAWIIHFFDVIVIALLQIMVMVDGIIFRMYNFHFNGFVWNLITTEGGLESIGCSTGTIVTFIIFAIAFLLIQALLLLLSHKSNFLKRLCSVFWRKYSLIGATILLVSLGFFQAITYGICRIQSYGPILSASQAFPFYQPVTFRRLAQKLGFRPKLELNFKTKSNRSLCYPLRTIQRKPPARKFNIVWLVAESLRADMLDPKIMPNTFAFAQKNINFRNHYSSGITTRMGLFGLFYGLYGPYWFHVVEENRGPIIFDVLIEDNYQISMYSSINFSYPEFHKTVLVRIPRSCLHDLSKLKVRVGWQCDRCNVTKLLKFLDHRDTSRPFMTYMFFNSSHARYYFPKECAIRAPFLKEFNYATMNLKRDISLIKNRYINSCYHLDTQFARILQYLKKHKLLDSTIVIITGDHGEEFMERGSWGHNSNFTDGQTKVPMVLRVPSQKARQVTDLTSHLDITPTLLTLLGVTNPSSDYSLGFDLLGSHRRRYTVACSWNLIGYIGEKYKASFSLKNFMVPKISTREDIPVSNPKVFYKKHNASLVKVMKDLSRFCKSRKRK